MKGLWNHKKHNNDKTKNSKNNKSLFLKLLDILKEISQISNIFLSRKGTTHFSKLLQKATNFFLTKTIRRVQAIVLWLQIILSKVIKRGNGLPSIKVKAVYSIPITQKALGRRKDRRHQFTITESQVRERESNRFNTIQELTKAGQTNQSRTNLEHRNLEANSLKHTSLTISTLTTSSPATLITFDLIFLNFGQSFIVDYQ